MASEFARQPANSSLLRWTGAGKFNILYFVSFVLIFVIVFTLFPGCLIVSLGIFVCCAYTCLFFVIFLGPTAMTVATPRTVTRKKWLNGANEHNSGGNSLKRTTILKWYLCSGAHGIAWSSARRSVNFWKTTFGCPFASRRQFAGNRTFAPYCQTEKVFGFVQCDVQVPEHLKAEFADLPPIFKNANITIDDVGETMQQYAQESGDLEAASAQSSFHRTMLRNSYFQQICFSGTLITDSRSTILHYLYNSVATVSFNICPKWSPVPDSTLTWLQPPTAPRTLQRCLSAKWWNWLAIRIMARPLQTFNDTWRCNFSRRQDATRPRVSPFSATSFLLASRRICLKLYQRRRSFSLPCATGSAFR